MALRSNGNTHHSTGVQHFGAAAVQSAYPSVLQQNFGQTNRIRNLTAGDGITSELVGLPSGYRHPAAWSMPQKAGLLSARNTISGTGTSSASGQSGYNVAAGISGDGGITDAPLGLIVSIAASLLASGGISAAQTEALASMVAALTGSGDVSAVAAGLATIAAMLSGSCDVVAGNTALMDIASTIRGYGDLTPEGIRDTVWQAILANYATDGTAGKTLSSAGAAADPLLGSVEGGLTLRDVQRIMLAALAGTSERVGNTITFTSPVDGTTVRISGSFDADNNRTGVVLDGD